MKSIYMDNRWEKLQEAKEGGIAYRYIYEAHGIRIVYPFIKRFAGTLGSIDYHDIVTPRGVAGIWFESDDQPSRGKLEYRGAAQEFEESFHNFCAEENIIAEFVRFSPWSDDHQMFSEAYSMRVYGTNYCNLLTHDFFHEEYPSRKQSKIRKMQREGVTISFERDDSHIHNFLRIYDYTQRKYDVSAYHRVDEGLLMKYLEAFPSEAIIAQANFEEKAISSSLILLGQDIAHFHLGGSDPEFHHMDANSLLLYEAALHAAEKGRKMFDLGDALKGSSLEKFKQSTAKGYPYQVGTRIRNETIYKAFVERAGGPSEHYFPEYRAPQGKR